jgi:phosphoribosylanthranilate isomerase
MNSVYVKICGITSPDDLQIAVEAGTDAIGMVIDVPQSLRNISLTQAKQLIKRIPDSIETVAVTVPKDLNDLVKIYNELNPTFIQIHGLEHLQKEIRSELSNTQLIGTFQVKPDIDIEAIKKMANYFDAIMLDSYVPGKSGGSGVTHNWKVSKKVRVALNPKHFFLAGGLTPDNVKAAIEIVKPFAVDVSTGVESSPGKKDRTKVFQFIKNAKEVEM